MSLSARLAEERRARLAAERLLELKQAELFAANRKLGKHARALSDEIHETRAEITEVRSENRLVKSQLGLAHEKIELVETTKALVDKLGELCASTALRSSRPARHLSCAHARHRHQDA